MVKALSLCALAVASACSTPAAPLPVPDRASRRAHLAGAETFLPVLSEAEGLDVLREAPVVILDADFYTEDDVTALRRAGTLSLGYVNIGEAETYRPFYDDVDPAWVLGDNPNWPGHSYVDAREAGWRRLVVDRVSRAIVAKRFGGLFLDMADVAAPGVHPETREGIERLILDLRAAYPTHLLVMNRGLFLLGDESRVEAAIDGVVVEGVFSHHDFATGETRTTAPARRDPLVAALRGFRDRSGGAALVLDYADTDAQRRAARAEAARYDLPIFVGAVDLGRRDDDGDA